MYDAVRRWLPTRSGTKRYPTSFAERNRIVIAIVGLLAMTGVFFATFHADSLPVIGGGDEHQAYLAEAAGLRPGVDVRVAGIKAGEVTDVELAGDRVVVTFRVKGVTLKDESTAAVKLKTMLGQKYLAIDPIGSEPLDGPIPVDRTTTPYDITAAFSDLSTTVDEIDTAQLEESLRMLSDVFADTPKSVRSMVDGLTRLSQTVASRDEELAELFDSTADVTGTLADRNEELGNLVSDSNLLLTELANRREAISTMLESTAGLSRQVRGLVEENREDLKPALKQLDRVVAILEANQKHLSDALEIVGPYYRLMADAMGNGRWIDGYLCGLFDDGAPALDNDVKRDCRPRGAK